MLRYVAFTCCDRLAGALHYKLQQRDHEDHKSARMARLADYGKQNYYCMSILLYEFALLSLNYLLAL